MASQCINKRLQRGGDFGELRPATMKDSSIERIAERDVEADQNGQTSAEVPVVNAQRVSMCLPKKKKQGIGS